MNDPDSSDQKKQQQKNFQEGVEDHNNERQQVVGITSDGKNIKRERPSSPDHPKRAT